MDILNEFFPRLAELTTPMRPLDEDGNVVSPVKNSVAKSVQSDLVTAVPDPPDPRSLEYARSLFVDCPNGFERLHIWHCAQCGRRTSCNAWRGHFHQVKSMIGRPKPYSLLILEAEELTEVKQ